MKPQAKTVSDECKTVAKQSNVVNPFYVVLVVVGIAFTLSACGFFVMSVRQTRPEEIGAIEESPMMQFFAQHGVLLLGVELALLAVATVAAIGSDNFWERRAEMRLSGKDNTPNVESPPTGQAADDLQEDPSHPSAGAPT